MNTFLCIFVIVAIIVILLLLIALILPKQYSVTVSETINKPKQTVYDYVRLFQYQTEYSEWLKADPTLKPEIVGIDGVEGTLLRWESDNPDKNKNVGSGEQEIKKIDENKIEIELRLIKPMSGTCSLIHEFAEKGKNVTEYTCTFSAYAKFPINLPSYLFGRSFIKKTQQKTLKNIKELLE